MATSRKAAQLYLTARKLLPAEAAALEASTSASKATTHALHKYPFFNGFMQKSWYKLFSTLFDFENFFGFC